MRAELAISDVEVLTADGITVLCSVQLQRRARAGHLPAGRPAPPGPCTISCRFSGTLNDKLRGFYRSTYTGLGRRDPDDGHDPVRVGGRTALLPLLRRAGPQGGLRDHPDRGARPRRHLELTRRRDRPGRRQAAHPVRPHHEDVDVPGGLRRRQARDDRDRRRGRRAAPGGLHPREAPAGRVRPGGRRVRVALLHRVLQHPLPRATRSTWWPFRTSPPGRWRTWAASPSATRPSWSTRTRRPAPSSNASPTSSPTSWRTCGSATS